MLEKCAYSNISNSFKNISIKKPSIRHHRLDCHKNSTDFSMLLTLRDMKSILFLNLFWTLVFAQECPTITPVTCGSEEITCPGGYDAEGCNMPNTCMPWTG